MRNPEEHKKLLEQITALERDSVNYFAVEKEFFLIDSDNLSKVQSRFYGYSIQADGIYEEDNLTPEAVKNLNGRGCYVYVEVRDGQITIKQDLNGSWGIYLFRHGDYFALSNSFFRLLDHVKFRYPLTVNRDYVHYLVTDILCSISYLETIVNEIQLVDRSAILHIDTNKKTLEMELINYREYSVSLDSPEGMTALERWVEFWGKVFRGITQNTQFFQADLSGGFDTRVSFALLLHSGVNLSNIRVFSVKGSVHTFKEDYDIASQIANHFNFKLNKLFPQRETFNYSLNDIFNADFYISQTFSNLHKLWYQKNIDKIYHLGGMSGETLRYRWQMPPEEFMETFTFKTNPYSGTLSEKLSVSIKNILESGLRTVCDKHNIKDTKSPAVPQYLYHETWSRYHFGKETLYSYFVNDLRISPALDPEVRTLRLNTAECPDVNLLIALLFTRYAPDLLKFPLDLNRSIAPETIAYAQKLNERFPRRQTTGNTDAGGGYFHLLPRDTHAEKILASARNNPNIPGGLPEKCLKATFESSKTYGLFTSYFDEELYRRAAIYYDTHVFGRTRPMYAVCGVAKVLEDVEISQRYYQPYQDMKRFIEQDFCPVYVNDSAEQIIRKFAPYITARTDVKLMTDKGDFKILSVSDDKANVTKPNWFQNGGIGYMITSYVGKLKFVAKAAADGQIQLRLRGIDMRNPKDSTKKIPYWIDYTKLTVNGKTIFDKLTPVWHDKPYRHDMDAKAGKEITFEVEWLPHRSDT